MGNCFKSNNRLLSHVDDSVKVMIRHDTAALEKKGQKPGGYVPRAPHPMLDKPNEEEPTQNTKGVIAASEEPGDDVAL